ncbi:unnamed protein product [Protopolystoma xenopodis]|uniref:Uncharacterized protein n=1 Tax=Protopolystoma xenopodis TaxID=117903 RepID=A0A448X4S1_9PLAT|nr:unnamed protein product [Protopolystoma xenopodis]
MTPPQAIARPSPSQTGSRLQKGSHPNHLMTTLAWLPHAWPHADAAGILAAGLMQHLANAHPVRFSDRGEGGDCSTHYFLINLTIMHFRNLLSINHS